MSETQSNDRFEMCNILKVLVIVCSLLFVYKYYYRTAPTIVRIKDPKFSLLGPYNITQYKLDDVYRQLIDIKDFSFKINPQPCKDYPNGLLLVVIVSSKPDNFIKRRLIRETWGRKEDYTKVVYLLGETKDSAISEIIEKESLSHGDIVQGSFIDAYRNMTYKHVMGLKWVSYYCSTAKYVLKTDDDVVVHSHALRQFLARELSPWGAKGLITCQLFVSSVVERDKTARWRVTEAEFAGKYYPTYCAGFAIIYSQDVVPRLLSMAQNMPYFWIDDAHITGFVAEKVGVARTPLDSLVLDSWRMNLLTSHGVKVGQFLFGPPDLSSSKIYEVWKAIPTSLNESSDCHNNS